ncbi:kielin/chordin-like protein [Mercenaria mercenaria]|uniref:kielin/chordin-like protein n=1 Tax=Mercenaria mercenaria TaxID=6596 RepID=UPI00234F87F5|nr:kielin/chordin-like protein [Mercenaria mercenaria]
MRGLRILFLLELVFLLASGVVADEGSDGDETNTKEDDDTGSENTDENASDDTATGGETGGKKCFIKGTFRSVKVGEIFRHPKNKCIACRCCENGKYTCRMRRCPPQPCGINKQTSFSKDGCCKECCEECTNTTCPALSCPNQAYAHNSCCKTCGCKYNGVVVPQGPFGHVCEQCVCQANGVATCNRKTCPLSKLECINPTFDDPTTCNYICPDGEFTCRRSNLIIPAGTVMARKNKICACNTDHWFTRAFCSDEPDLFRYLPKMSELRQERCMAQHNLPEIIPNPLPDLQGP